MFTIKNPPAEKAFKMLHFLADPRKRGKGRRFPPTPLWGGTPKQEHLKEVPPISCICIPGSVVSEQGIKARTHKHEKYAHFSQSQVPMARSLGNSGSGRGWRRDGVGAGRGGDTQLSQSWLRNLAVISQSTDRN